MEPIDGTKQYLEYLDKEMTIMGILSTFCVAAAALVVDKVGSADKDSIFRTVGQEHALSVFTASASLILSGLFFYLQRSRLAHFYGSICMSIAEPHYHSWGTHQWLKDAYSWHAWLRYRIAFSFLEASAVLYGHVLYRTILPSKPPFYWVVWALLALIAITAAAQFHVMTKYRNENEPWIKWQPLLRRSKRWWF